MAGISSAIYKQVSLPPVDANAAFLTTVFVGAFAFEIAFDSGSDRVWDAMNRGRQWKDIRHKYVQDEE
ncbi:hypothetical protein AJ80_06493 [Polytolypa hystricis UAMH7299]|uniref:Complex III subunit 9 n=1 Tax=Polytolypa hystricis (strain UAMH7299) TaxID=1447883 RepID=A0A2B7XVM6_POLH7|nr:hypothetical protein AJ80_06493 [Polytolypa hystricis UAMH7299]